MTSSTATGSTAGSFAAARLLDSFDRKQIAPPPELGRPPVVPSDLNSTLRGDFLRHVSNLGPLLERDDPGRPEWTRFLRRLDALCADPAAAINHGITTELGRITRLNEGVYRRCRRLVRRERRKLLEGSALADKLAALRASEGDFSSLRKEVEAGLNAQQTALRRAIEATSEVRRVRAAEREEERWKANHEAALTEAHKQAEAAAAEGRGCSLDLVEIQRQQARKQADEHILRAGIHDTYQTVACVFLQFTMTVDASIAGKSYRLFYDFCGSQLEGQHTSFTIWVPQLEGTAARGLSVRHRSKSCGAGGRLPETFTWRLLGLQKLESQQLKSGAGALEVELGVDCLASLGVDHRVPWLG